MRAHTTCKADTEEIVAEAYLKAARSFESFDPSRAQFGTWVTAIARNCMISHFRRAQRTASLDEAPETEHPIKGQQDAVDNALTLEKLLACLDNTDRKLVTMKYHDEMRNIDIAAALGMNPSTVSTRLSRALAKMRAAAREQGM